MKSDREFLDGIYVKAEKLTADAALIVDIQQKKDDSAMKQRGSTRYVKYAGLAASFLIFISSAIFLNNYIGRNNEIVDTPTPSSIRIVNYHEQLIEQASDIIAVETGSFDDKAALSITEGFKTSGNEGQLLNALDSTMIGLKEGESAIVFMKFDSGNFKVLDAFIWDKENGAYSNQYGESIDLESLKNLRK